MKAFRRQRGQCSVGDHYFSRCPTLAREAPGDKTECPSFGFLIGKSYDDHAGSIMALANSSKPGFCASRVGGSLARPGEGGSSGLLNARRPNRPDKGMDGRPLLGCPCCLPLSFSKTNYANPERRDRPPAIAISALAPHFRAQFQDSMALKPLVHPPSLSRAGGRL